MSHFLALKNPLYILFYIFFLCHKYKQFYEKRSARYFVVLQPRPSGNGVAIEEGEQLS